MSDRRPDPAATAARQPQSAPRRWTLADDYLADPAVAPLRALLAALARRLGARARRPRRGPGSRRPDRGAPRVGADAGAPPARPLRPPRWAWGRLRSQRGRA